MVNARQVAYDILLKTEKQGAYSNIILDSVLSKTKLDTRDKSFVSALFYGVIERKLTIDYQLQKYLTKPLKKLKPDVLLMLRIGAYQILFMDKVPTSAAVNETVSLAKKNGCAYAAGLINAVLRKVDKAGLQLPENTDSAEYLSVRYSCPQWLVEKWITEYGHECAEGLLSASLGSPECFIRVNNVKTTEQDLISLFYEEGIICNRTDYENTLTIELKGKDIEQLNSFKKGLFHVQDLSCQLCVKALRVQQGQTVFDLCSAPGGKAYTIAETMQDSGQVFCFDIHKNRVDLINNGAKRLGLTSIKGAVSDASVFNEEIGSADRVLCDVPCSGLGIIRRKPEIKYKNKDELDSLPEIQLKILKNGSRYVKKGGILVYSTCTLSKDENEHVCMDFLKNNSNFEALIPLPEISDEKFITLMPHESGGDGFFIAAFKRKG